MRKELKEKGIKKAENVEKKPYMVPFDQMKREAFNPKGEHLGKIEDVILDLNNQRIAFGILSFGGIFGLGERRYAIPWSMLKYKPKEEKFVLNIDKAKLILAEGFEPQKYPYPYYGPWAPALYGHWGYRPYWQL